MKPHLPLPLLRAVLACFAALSTTLFTATAAEPTIPGGYTKAEIDEAADLASWYANSNYAFLLTNADPSQPLTLTPVNCSWWSASTATVLFTGRNYFFSSWNTDTPISLTFDGGESGAPSAFRKAGTLEFQGLGDVDFLNLYITTTTSGSPAYGGAIFASSSSPLTFIGNGDITFSGNYATSTADFAYGGAIFADSSLTFSGNRDITFSGNYATGSFAGGGAIYASSSSLTFSGNGDITFGGNYATGSSARGGAIHAYSSLTFSG
ncbi:MAG: hypothetical protein MSQ05_03790, partial [Akkermansia sp.]|nr:hypothetical protein [Akkermansia sp.]